MALHKTKTKKFGFSLFLLRQTHSRHLKIKVPHNFFFPPTNIIISGTAGSFGSNKGNQQKEKKRTMTSLAFRLLFFFSFEGYKTVLPTLLLVSGSISSGESILINSHLARSFSFPFFAVL